MSKMQRISAITISSIFLALALTICGSPSSLSTTSKPHTSSTNSSLGIVPDTLTTIEGHAEDIIDIVPSGQWEKVSTDVAAIASAWATYQPQATQDGATQIMQDAFTSALKRLQTTSTAKDAPGTMQAANDLGSAVIDLFDVYHPATPTDIGRLDVLERQIVLDMAVNNFTAVTDTLGKIKTVWERVKPSVVAHNGAAVAAQFDTSLTGQATALNTKDWTALTNEAKNGLEIVDALEKVF